MNRYHKFLLCLIAGAAFLSCARKVINVEKKLVEQVITEFTEERMAHYLHGGAPKPNAEILEKVLSRHSLKLHEFKPAFRRYFPEVHTRLLGS